MWNFCSIDFSMVLEKFEAGDENILSSCNSNKLNIKDAAEWPQEKR